MPCFTVFLSNGDTSFRYRSRVVRSYTWDALFNERYCIRFESLDTAKIWISNIDPGLQTITFNRTDDYFECRCKVHKNYPFNLKVISTYDRTIL